MPSVLPRTVPDEWWSLIKSDLASLSMLCLGLQGAAAMALRRLLDSLLEAVQHRRWTAQVFDGSFILRAQGVCTGLQYLRGVVTAVWDQLSHSSQLPDMRTAFFFSALTATLGLAGAGHGSPVIERTERRQNPDNRIGEPLEGSTIAGGSSFPFSYTPSYGCYDPYSLFTVWLVPGPDPPTLASLNSTEEFSPGDYLAFFGTWIESNNPGLPPISPGPAPPTFTMPVLDPSFIDETVYLAVVETIPDCDPLSYTAYIISSIDVTYTD
ncbi:hypothetical protein NM688_g6952 [Phlebia brevispora]|uniref:Uncharacterized protein n=1 Tax=Phlebia brevispora TaxID=194682 RepID=A0ACC1SAL4_9APHY|nr:hypothetical protein NM688_g6952 [Phlebia brevispora]